MPPKSHPPSNELPSIAELLARADALFTRTSDYAKSADVSVLSTHIEHLKGFVEETKTSLKEVGEKMQAESKSNAEFKTSIQLQIRQLWYAVIALSAGMLAAGWQFIAHLFSGK